VVGGGHPHNHPGLSNDWELVVNGLLCSIIDTVQAWEGHACQYWIALLAVVEVIRGGEVEIARNGDPSILSDEQRAVTEIEMSRAERLRWIANIMRLDYDLPCIFTPGSDGANGPPGSSGKAGDSGDPPPGKDNERGNDLPGAGPGPGTPPSGGDVDPVVPQGVATSVYRLAQDVVEVKAHRRLRKPDKYVRTVVAEIKNRLGCPPANAANLLAVRRMAVNIMEKHGVRPSHVRRAVELVVAGVFVPDEDDLVGAKILQSNSVAALREELDNAGPKPAWASVFHPFRDRRVRRVRAA